MIIEYKHDLKRFDKVIASMKLFFSGSGDPADEHDIVAVTIDGHSFGKLPALKDVDKIIQGNDIMV